jgi:glycosyltransferase involved in cell wall biosynthesis
MESSSKKIIIVGPAYPYRGGIAAFSERLAAEFAARGANVQLVTFTLQYPSFLFPGKTQYSEGQAPEGLQISRMLNSCNPFNWIKTGLRLRKMKADKILFAFWTPFMAPAMGVAACIAKKSGARCIGLVHNLIPHERKPMDKFLSRFFCNSMDAFVTMSDSVLQDIHSFVPAKPATMCPHPLYDHYGTPVSREEAIDKLGLSKDFRYLLFFGLIRDYKGLDWLLETFADPRLEAFQDLRLIVAGEFYSDPQKYQDAAQALGRRVIMRPEFIPDDMVRYYFCAADLIVQPYKTATQSGITQIAYHFDKPMLVTRVGGLPEIVPDGIAGYVAEPSVNAIADALVHFASNRPDFSAGIVSQKQKYSWEKMADAVEGV